MYRDIFKGLPGDKQSAMMTGVEEIRRTNLARKPAHENEAKSFVRRSTAPMTAAARLSTHFVLQGQKYARNRPLISFPCTWALLARQRHFTLDEEGSRKIWEMKTKDLPHRC
jgi:hypothetical protein